MQTINAPSLEEAIIKASSLLGCSVVDLEYEVVQAPCKGFLGLGKKEAILKVQRKPQIPNPSQESPQFTPPSPRAPANPSHHPHSPQIHSPQIPENPTPEKQTPKSKPTTN
ncbi:hypothetical protein NHP190012_05290 [Helicobacter sp. NHP19-012]|uniref:RNA-binding protein KhpB N-terminal domain-containing protein n=1 Tax=Helicobacter gastrofelis TaxID=2849642 RepID=A0ABM7SL66_9HELI|nr:Jag N-terminal domain-containing protein [Helicobacter sp. NHP19-012]BCZ18887.1 hypothetical protein NHP190012_05290 [Helicobacter sp. NHP19-012]